MASYRDYFLTGPQHMKKTPNRYRITIEDEATGEPLAYHTTDKIDLVRKLIETYNKMNGVKADYNRGARE